MTTIPHQPPVVVSTPWWIEARNMWVSLAITVIWLAVLFTAIFGPNIETTDAAPGSSATVPSALGVAFFAVFATWAVAKYGFDRRSKDS
jgi:hypothetical protein